MVDQKQVFSRLSRFTAFATLGVLGTTQDMARILLERLKDADPEGVAEETLCMVATATARAAEVGLRQEGLVSTAVTPTIMDIPFAYRDYLIGGAMITRKDTSLLVQNEKIYQRLHDTRSFYSGQFPANQFPGGKDLVNKMELWLGRVNPSNGSAKLSTAELTQLGIVKTFLTHLKLILAFGRQG